MLALIVAFAYHSWQVYRPEEPVSGPSSRGMQIARITAGRFITPMEAVSDHSERGLRPASVMPGRSSLQGDGFGSYLAWIVARVYQCWQVYHPEEAIRILGRVGHLSRVL